MSDANKDLADVRGWLCDNLSSGDAGKVCGMLSSVSRRINELEAENAKLREQVTRLQDDWESERDYADQMEAKEKQAVGENAKLRELVRKWYPHMVRRVGKDALAQWGQLDVLRKLGIEVDE